MIDTAKLQQITTLDRGDHDGDSGAMCAMEAVAWIAGEPWSDAPQCASPVISQFMRSWNDALPNADRTRVLMPLLPEIIGTRTTETDEQTRAWMAMDWAVRVYTPRWLREAGLTDHAVRIERLAPLVDAAAAIASKQTLTAARIAAHDAARAAARAVAWDAARAVAWDAAHDAARAAARAAAWDAARAAAWDAARAVAWDAAGAVARAAAWAAAGDAARAAAWAAAGDAARAVAWDAARAAARAVASDALAPTVAELQTSAQDLVRRMCAVGRVAAAEQEVGA